MIDHKYTTRIYRWKDNKGKTRTSVGIVLSQSQQKALCEKNLAMIAEQTGGE